MPLYISIEDMGFLHTMLSLAAGRARAAGKGWSDFLSRVPCASLVISCGK